MRRIARISSWFLVAAIATSAGVARSQDAEALIKEGVELRAKGADEEALAKFRAAWDASHLPKARAQMALAEQALGRWVDAEAHLNEALAATADAWIAQHRKALEDALAEIGKHVGSLDVRGTIAGPTVLLNGKPIGTLPFASPVRVEAGSWTLEVRMSGYYPVSKTIIVGAGQLTRESVELVATTAPAPTTSMSTSTTFPVGTTNASPSSPETLTAGGSTQRSISYVTFGAGIVGVGFGTIAILKRNAASNAYNDDKGCPGIDAASQPSVCQARLDDVDRWKTASIASFVLGGALIATSIVLYVSAPTTRTSTAVSLGCGSGPAPLGASCKVTF